MSNLNDIKDFKDLFVKLSCKDLKKLESKVLEVDYDERCIHIILDKYRDFDNKMIFKVFKLTDKTTSIIEMSSKDVYRLKLSNRNNKKLHTRKSFYLNEYLFKKHSLKFLYKYLLNTLGEDYVDFNTTYNYIIVWYPQIVISNSTGNTYVNKDIYIKYSCNGGNTINTEIGKATYDVNEITLGFIHPHLSNSSGEYSKPLTSFCLGTSPLKSNPYPSTLLELITHHNLVYYLLEWESLEGGPYGSKSINSIKNKAYYLKPIPRVGYDIKHIFDKFIQTMYDLGIEDCIYSDEKDLHINTGMLNTFLIDNYSNNTDIVGYFDNDNEPATPEPIVIGDYEYERVVNTYGGRYVFNDYTKFKGNYITTNIIKTNSENYQEHNIVKQINDKVITRLNEIFQSMLSKYINYKVYERVKY